MKREHPKHKRHAKNEIKRRLSQFETEVLEDLAGAVREEIDKEIIAKIRTLTK